jgi:D-glucosaminate-6-phosphate ammonia-lyase
MAEKRTETLELNRREWLGQGGLWTTAALLSGASTVSAAAGASETGVGAGVYERIGVRPFINCKGTYTILSGSLTLPQVKAAMEEASRHYVHIDELMEAVGGRLARLTGAAWGIVTAGCSAAETVATCACIAGSDPEKIRRLPDLAGMKDEVVIPRYSRNAYDQAVRMVGVRMVEVDSLDELKNALGPRTAMVYILACPEDQGPLGLEVIAGEAGKHGVPVFVDAAAENLTPEIHLDRGADLVAYSGGKAIRGPQCAGLLLGREDLVRAAWVNNAPHHGFCRSLKVGKEEIMGMLAAVEAWYERDHDQEWKTWESWLGEIASWVEGVPGVRTTVKPPTSLSNNAPQLEVSWDPDALGIGGEEVDSLLWRTDPRIALAWGRGSRKGGADDCSVGIMPWMMRPGDAAIVGNRLGRVLESPPRVEPDTQAPPVDVAGAWEVTVDYRVALAVHTFYLSQEGRDLKGLHLGERLQGRLLGRVNGDRVLFTSSQRHEGSLIDFKFEGRVTGDRMRGEVSLGQYGQASWNAVKAPS